MVELIQIVHQDRNKLMVKERDAVHRDGDWHETFQCWFVEIVEGEPYIYLQKRSRTKKDFPGMFDITAAGHLLVNETAEDGVREIKEELGIELNFCNLHYLTTIPNSIHLEGFIDNEISLVYLYIVDKPLNFIFQDGEVEEIVKVRLTDFERLCTGEISSVAVELIIVDDYTAVPLEAMNLDHIVPHETSYFVKVINEIRFKI